MQIKGLHRNIYNDAWLSMRQKFACKTEARKLLLYHFYNDVTIMGAYEKCRGYLLNANTKSRVREIRKHGSARGGRRYPSRIRIPSTAIKK